MTAKMVQQRRNGAAGLWIKACAHEHKAQEAVKGASARPGAKKGCQMTRSYGNCLKRP